MSACSIELSIKDLDRPHPTGSVVRGSIVVTALKACHINGISVLPRWTTHGWATSHTGEEKAVHVGEACDVLEGNELRYQFECTLPDTPASYEGTLFGVHWDIAARVDIAMGIDAKAEERIVVTHDGASPVRDPASMFDPDSLKRRQHQSVAMRFIRQASGAMLVTFVILLIVGLRGDWTDPSDSTLFEAILALLAGAGIFVLLSWRAIRNLLRGAITVSIDPVIARRGGTLTCAATMLLKKTARLTDMTVRLELREFGRRQAGKHSQTKYHPVFSSEHSNTVGDDIQGGVERSVSVRVPIPAEQPCSLSASDAKLEWRLVVRLNFEKGGFWEDDFPVAVVV
jgi:hypothetical protein